MQYYSPSFISIAEARELQYMATEPQFSTQQTSAATLTQQSTATNLTTQTTNTMSAPTASGTAATFGTLPATAAPTVNAPISVSSNGTENPISVMQKQPAKQWPEWKRYAVIGGILAFVVLIIIWLFKR